MFVSRFQKNLVILYQSGETQIWVLINVLGAFHLGLIPIITTVYCYMEISLPESWLNSSSRGHDMWWLQVFWGLPVWQRVFCLLQFEQILRALPQCHCWNLPDSVPEGAVDQCWEKGMNLVLNSFETMLETSNFELPAKKIRWQG